MRTISNLYNEGDTVFICFENETIGKKFLQDAEKEGFLINGELPPATGNTSKIYLLKKGYIIHPISGFVMHIFFGSGVKTNKDKKVVRINYGNYTNGAENYYYQKGEQI